MYCCFSGHRPEQLPWIANEEDVRCKELKNVLNSLIEQSVLDGYTDFYSGMARGIDMYAAEEVLKISEKYPSVRLHAVLPCTGQENRWCEADRERYNLLLDKAHSKIIISPFYTDTCMLSRNRYMVDNSTRLIAVWNGHFRGGTAYTVRYAKSKNKEIFIVRSKDSSISLL